MKQKNGFISTTIIYAFFLVFILIMIAILLSYSNKAFLKDKISDNIDQPGDNNVICKKGDKLSDCLFKMEYNEHKGGYLSSATKNDINSIKSVIAARTPNLTKVEKTEKGMYNATSEEGSTYYYRGKEDDNYVSFAGKLWSILRVNNNGSIRLVYQGDKLVNGTNTKAVVESNIKNKSYISVDGNSALNSNDARHFNYNKMGELKCNSYVMSMKANEKYIEMFCQDDILKNGVLDSIETNFCSLSEEQRKSALNNINSCGNKEYNGAVSLWNVGYMRNPDAEIGVEDKLGNQVESDVLGLLNTWYDVNLKIYEGKIEKNAIYCGNKDVATRSGSLTGTDYLEKNHCYCENSSVSSQPKFNIIEHDPSLFATWTCSGDIFGTCPVNDYSNDGGLQINYYTRTAQNILRKQITNFNCGSGNNSKFSAGIDNASTTKVKNPIGLINTAELFMAGASYGEENSDMFLATSFPYWTGDLAFGNNNNGLNDTFYFIMNKNNIFVLNDYKKDNVAYIKPVITLNNTVEYESGKGTIDDPYEIIGG